jgi:hypothetical protein
VTTVALWRMTSTAGGAAIFVALLRVRAAQASERARARTTERAAGGGRWAVGFVSLRACGREAASSTPSWWSDDWWVASRLESGGKWDEVGGRNQSRVLPV